MQEFGKIKLQDRSGNVDNFINKIFSGRIPFCTTIAMNILLGKILKLHTITIVPKSFA